MTANPDFLAKCGFLVKKFASEEQWLRVRRAAANLASYYCANDLAKLARIYQSDKWGSHWYAKHYETHLRHLRKKPVTVLEIGIGGFEDPAAGGASLRMWRRFFPNGRIFGINIIDKSAHNGSRIKTFQGDQTDEAFLRKVIAEIGQPDIIVDDGSHFNKHVITTFGILFPLLKDGGMYAVEDTQTAYWPEYGGSSENLENNTTSLNMMKKLTDGLNYQEFLRPQYTPTYFDRNIVSMHFYHNLVFLHKGSNCEGSNLVQNNKGPG